MNTSLMKIIATFAIISPFLIFVVCGEGAEISPHDAGTSLSGLKMPASQVNKIAQLASVDPFMRNYPMALDSLLSETARQTGIRLDEQPVLLNSFESPDLFKYPFIYVNFSDRKDWTFSPLEVENLRAYLERGGFIFIDAGVNAEFLRKDLRFGQHHSYADWQVTPALADAFRQVFPDSEFEPLKRSHELFKCFYAGLPDPSQLPDTVKEYVVNEKWPDGTYSLLALNVNGRIAVLASPIIAMGWGRDSVGRWTTQINFRVREGTRDISERLRTASYSGERFEAHREDGMKDIIYCQNESLPAWVQEPDGRWRVFRYYQSREISDYAHVFYTRLGINILVYAFTH